MCTALCVAHFIAFVARLVMISSFNDRKGFPVYCNNVQEILDISVTVLLILITFACWSIMLYYGYKGLDITPIKGMCIYMFLPGVTIMIFDVVAEKVSPVTTLFWLLNMAMATVMLAPAA